MRPLHCLVLVTVLLATSCSRGPTDEQNAKLRDGTKAARPSTPRPIAETILGNWATEDPGKLRAVHFQKDNVVTFVLEVQEPATFKATYLLAGKQFKIYRGPQDTIGFTINCEVIDFGEDFLLLRDDESPKPQRFTRK